MPDFSHLLKKQAGGHKRPEAIMAGNYPAVVSKLENGDNNKNKTPYVRLFFRYTGWPDSVPPDARQESGPNGLQAIDLSKKQPRRDMFLTDDSLWRLDKLLGDLGIALGEGISYESAIPQLIGKNVLLEVKQGLNQKDNSIFNEIGEITAL